MDKSMSAARRSQIARKAAASRRRNLATAGSHGTVAKRGASGRSSRPTFVPTTTPGNAALSKKLDRLFDAIVLGLKAQHVDVSSLFPAPPEPKREPTPAEKFRAGMEALAKKHGVTVESIMQPGGISEDVANTVLMEGIEAATK